MQRIVVLTGAGISKESGIATFRDIGGVWQQYRVEEVASPEGFAANPTLVHEFYNARRRQLLTPAIAPNAGHRALAEFAARTAAEFLLVTQNVDDLHERAGSSGVLHMHGELLKARCTGCGAVRECREDLSATLPCPDCQRPGGLRPHIVWFGEMPMDMDRIYAALERCDLFVAIGTSGQVYPAAGFIDEARRSGAHTVEINPEPTGGRFHQVIQGPASTAVAGYFSTLA